MAGIAHEGDGVILMRVVPYSKSKDRKRDAFTPPEKKETEKENRLRTQLDALLVSSRSFARGLQPNQDTEHPSTLPSGVWESLH